MRIQQNILFILSMMTQLYNIHMFISITCLLGAGLFSFRFFAQDLLHLWIMVFVFCLNQDFQDYKIFRIFMLWF